ncbi:excinuclease ABC subunit C [Pedobacter ginsenosidimutans]|uniref:Excinuclease ABC subunit C n=1 Tax=Pedobacter ginsenosidimutans TaxID=687842 RepID=A0A0T5VSH7_9SPHI|nr:GIY-YIG nuclease family protein [Pedobacter ginsenosidimutans]KRT16500.1 excinuclease ABC subunit C [Pedobacter ginsenosidimutans]
MKTYTVYILKCADNSYYTGVTNDIDRRLYEHENAINVNCYTAERRPLALVFCEHFEDINDAISFEKQVKGWSRKKKEAIINDNWDKLKALSICKNITSHTNFTK